MSKKKKIKGVMYSTDPDFEYVFEEDDQQETLSPDEQRLKVWIDRKQRKGKVVTIVEGFIGTAEDLNALGKQIKVKCGSGGSVKEGVIIIQGDLKEKVTGYLRDEGYGVK